MAIEKRQGHPHGHREPESRTDFEAVLDHVRDNALVYVAGVVFTLVAIVAGVAYYSASEAARKESATEYMAALIIEDPAERIAALSQVAGSLSGELAAEALYMAAETAFDDGDLDTARQYYERVRAEHGGTRFAAPAAEGLGHIHEDAGEYGQAMDLYHEVLNNHAYAFEARRQWYNLGRVAEKQDDLEAAIEHYTEQINGFPGSSVAQQAQMALERLRREHPDLFPDDFEMPADPGIMLDGAAVGLEGAPALDAILDETPAETPAEPVEVEADALVPDADAPAPEPVEAEAEPVTDEDGGDDAEDEAVEDETEAAEETE